MNREEIVELISGKIKSIRLDLGYSQEKMAEMLGLSKKTLVQIEKQRIVAGWTVVIAICALFREHHLLQMALGGDPLETIETTVRSGVTQRKEKTLGGKVWWTEVSGQLGYILQKNNISMHYRILDDEQYRIYSSLDEQEAKNRFQELISPYKK